MATTHTEFGRFIQHYRKLDKASMLPSTPVNLALAKRLICFEAPAPALLDPETPVSVVKARYQQIVERLKQSRDRFLDPQCSQGPDFTAEQEAAAIGRIQEDLGHDF